MQHVAVWTIQPTAPQDWIGPSVACFCYGAYFALPPFGKTGSLSHQERNFSLSHTWMALQCGKALPIRERFGGAYRHPQLRIRLRIGSFSDDDDGDYGGANDDDQQQGLWNQTRGK